MKQEINCKIEEEKPLTLDEAIAHAEERYNNLPDLRTDRVAMYENQKGE